MHFVHAHPHKFGNEGMPLYDRSKILYSRQSLGNFRLTLCANILDEDAREDPPPIYMLHVKPADAEVSIIIYYLALSQFSAPGDLN